MDRQCSSCGGFCRKSGCERENVKPEQEPVAFYVYKPTLPRGNLGNVADGDLPWIYDQDPSSGYSARMLVYTTPPQRVVYCGCGDEIVGGDGARCGTCVAVKFKEKEWVGLTREERDEIQERVHGAVPHHVAFAHAIEQALKEKNGG